MGERYNDNHKGLNDDHKSSNRYRSPQRILSVSLPSLRYVVELIIQCSVQRVLSAYEDDRPFSVDLVNAVVRQCSFVDKMHEFGWTAPGFFDGPETELVLQHAIARYHG